MQVLPQYSRYSLPLSQVVQGINYKWEDPLIQRWDRRRAITVQASPHNATATEMRNSVVKAFDAIKLPSGYTLEWDGEYNSSKESIDALIPGISVNLLNKVNWSCR